MKSEHEIGNLNCAACAPGYPTPCPSHCGGLLHSGKGCVRLAECDKCGEDYVEGKERKAVSELKNYDQCAACGHVRVHHTENCTVERCSCPAFREPPSGEQTCPQRMSRIGPWERREGIDYWSTSRWGEYYEARWDDRFERPRTCSFCGGVRPEDAIKLLDAGWETERTSKHYKLYLHPPGYRAAHEALMSALIERRTPPQSPHKEPTPPVKIYLYHFDQEQARRVLEGA